MLFQNIQPKAAWLTVNQACNFRCQWCYIQDTKYQNNNEMSFELAVTLAKISAEIGISNIIIIGGEPTLWEPLVSFNKFCRELGIKTSLVTNGFMFSNDEFFENYQKQPNDGLGVSLKAGNSYQLLKIAKFRDFEGLTKGMRRIFQNYSNASISITLNSFYLKNFPQLVKLAVECGSKTVKIDFCSPIFKNGKPVNKYIIDPLKLVSFVFSLYPELDKITHGNLVFEMNLPFCLWPEGFINLLKMKHQIISVCQMLKQEGIIFGPDGRVQMCNALFDFPIGYWNKDFNDGRSLINFLNREKVVNYYEGMRRYPLEKCQDCEWYLECGGGCPLRWLIWDPKKLILRERRL